MTYPELVPVRVPTVRKWTAVPLYWFLSHQTRFDETTAFFVDLLVVEVGPAARSIPGFLQTEVRCRLEMR